MHSFSLFIGALVLALGAEAINQDLIKAPLSDKPEIDTYAFESEIKDLLEKVRSYLKDNGYEPFSFPKYAFDFFLQKSSLDGFVGEMLIHNLSDFKYDNVKFDLLQFKITLDLIWDVLILDGQYKLHGNIFEDLLDGEGRFLSNTTNLVVKFDLELGSNILHSEIKHLIVTFTMDDDYIIYDNSVTGDKDKVFDNSFLQPFLYRIRDEYFPLLCNTLKVVGSDLLYDYPIQDIIEIIIGIITGGGGSAMDILRSLSDKN